MLRQGSLENRLVVQRTVCTNVSRKPAPQRPESSKAHDKFHSGQRREESRFLFYHVLMLRSLVRALMGCMRIQGINGSCAAWWYYHLDGQGFLKLLHRNRSGTGGQDYPGTPSLRHDNLHTTNFQVMRKRFSCPIICPKIVCQAPYCMLGCFR